ncbi:anthrone oxygenase family protein [Streptomyces inhibens]|uniref:anthrone oxygenase family protein n=1 Tax=Streptomyces inhibens TaxID=2293571 RepID=UPI00402AB725
MRALQTATLLVATLGAGLMAGLFAAFAYAVMPGLGRSGDRTFVQAMQNINRAIVNGWFLLPFLLPIPLLILATVLAWNGPGRVALPCILAALVLYMAGFFVTSAVNVPLNNALDKAETGEGATDGSGDGPGHEPGDGPGGGSGDGSGDGSGNGLAGGSGGHLGGGASDGPDDGSRRDRLKAARDSFERRWVTWNIVRALAHTAAFGLLAWALFLHGTAGTA